MSLILLELYLTDQGDCTDFMLLTDSALGFTATGQVPAEVQVDEENLWMDIVLFLP